MDINYQKIFTASPYGCLIVNEKGEFVGANDAYCQMTGYSQEQLLTMSIMDVDVTKDHDEIKAHIDRILKNGKDCIEARNRCLNGDIIDVEVTGEIYDQQRSQFFAFIRDITDFKKAEKQASLFRNALDRSADQIFLIDPQEMKFVDANETACRDLQYSRDELLSMGPQDIKPLYERKQLEDEFDRMFSQEIKTGTLETVHECKDGKRIPVEVHLSVLEGGSQQVVVAMARDITERKKAEHELRDREQRLALVVQGADLGTWDWDTRTNTVIYNRTWAEMKGYQLEEIRQHLSSWEELVHPEDLPRVRQKLDDHFKSRTSYYEAEFRMRHKSGEWVWVMDKGMVLERDETGVPLRVCGTHFNITERKKREQENLLHSLYLRHIQDMITVTDLQGRILYVNKIAENMFGKSLDELKGKDISVFGEDPEQGTIQQEILRESLEHNSWRGEVVNIDKDGNHILLDCRTFVVNNEAGEPFALVGISMDVTERKKVERELQESRERLSSAIAAARQGAWEWDLQKDTAFFSDEVVAMFGYSREELGDGITLWRNSIHPQDQDRVMTVIEEHFRQKTKEYHQEYRLRCKGGEWRWVQVSGKVVEWDENGKPKKMSGIFQDIHERKQSEERLQNTLKDLKEFEKVAIDREIAMINLKKQVNDLSEQLGKKPPYDVSFDED